jgi:hypothetical protein
MFGKNGAVATRNELSGGIRMNDTVGIRPLSTTFTAVPSTNE